MRLFNRKSQLQRLADTVMDGLDGPSGLKPSMPSPGKGVKAGLIAAGGLAGRSGAARRERATIREADGGSRAQESPL